MIEEDKLNKAIQQDGVNTLSHILDEFQRRYPQHSRLLIWTHCPKRSKTMKNESFEITAAKYGLTPERLDKLYAELYVILAAYEVKEICAVTELIESRTPGRSHNKGAAR